MNIRKSLMAVVAAILAVSLASPVLAQKTVKPVRIGFAIALTGEFAPAAPSQMNAYQLWKDQVNAAGGLDIAGEGKRPVKFVYYDDQSKPALDARIYEKLITQDKVDLLLAPWGTSATIAVAPVVERYKFPMIGNTAAAMQLLKLKSGNIWFVTAAFPNRQAQAVADMMKARGYKTAAVLADLLPYSQQVKKFLVPDLKKDGIKVVVDTDYPPGAKNMSVMLSKVKNAKPDAIISLSYPRDSALYTQTAKALGLKAQFQYVQIGPTENFFTKLLGKSANGILTFGDWSPARNALSQKFYDAYVKKYGQAPDASDSAESWVSLEILQQAVAKAGLDKAKLRHVISTDTFKTMYGPIKFTGVQNLVSPAGVSQIQNGKTVTVWPTDLQGAVPFQPKTGW